MKTTLMASVMMTAAVVCAAPTTWTVSKTGDDTTAAADTSGGTPFQHIQVAINNAKKGDTIQVGPGTYGEEEGVTEDGNGRSRIYISKELKIVSTDGASATHIVGAFDTTSGSTGVSAVRCITAVGGVVIDGFTLRGGGTAAATDATGRSGGIYTTGANAAAARRSDDVSQRMYLLPSHVVQEPSISVVFTSYNDYSDYGWRLTGGM